MGVFINYYNTYYLLYINPKFNAHIYIFDDHL